MQLRQCRPSSTAAALRTVRTGAALLVLLSGLVLTSTARAEDEAGDDNEPDKDIERVVEISCRDDQGRPESWLDRTHSYFNERLCEPAAWFDGFFGDSRAEEETPVGSFFRLRNSVRWDEDEKFGHKVQLSANISLPRVSDRVRLLISRGETLEDDLGQSDARTEEDDEQTRLGLRLLLSGTERTQFDVDGTVKVNTRGLNPRVRARGRHTVELTDATLARFTQIGFWEREEGLGTSTRLDWEWLPSSKSLVRLTGRGTFSEASDGVDWRAGLIGFRQLNRRTAIRSELGAFGYTRPDFEAEEIFVNFRFRRSFLRDWLFYELQPEYAWPIDENTGRRRSDLRFIVTLEIQFENAALARARAERVEEDDEPPLDHYRGR
ncbi:MAG: hypothetical protein ACNA7W_07775 [Pseudomonadales bacterium]